MIPSKQRATVLSFDSLMGSSGGVVAQPVLGRVADVYRYPPSFVLAGAFAVLSVPFLIASRRANDPRIARATGRTGSEPASKMRVPPPGRAGKNGDHETLHLRVLALRGLW